MENIERILGFIRKQEWGNPSKEPFKYVGKTVIHWHCRSRMLKFQGLDNDPFTIGRITVLVCQKCGYLEYRKFSYFDGDILEKKKLRIKQEAH